LTVCVYRTQATASLMLFKTLICQLGGEVFRKQVLWGATLAHHLDTILTEQT
jgi:hypothetical protein